jgi:hypothetical protein
MRESRLYGSVRGALRNERPYRDPRVAPRNDSEDRRVYELFSPDITGPKRSQVSPLKRII